MYKIYKFGEGIDIKELYSFEDFDTIIKVYNYLLEDETNKNIGYIIAMEGNYV